MVLVVDHSGSMKQDDKIGGLKRAVSTFMEGLPAGSKVAVVAFSDEVEVICPFTTDPARVREAVESLEANGGTRYFDAVSAALDLLGEHSGRRAILALTDGLDTESQSVHAGEQGDRPKAKALGLPVHTLRLRRRGGSIAVDDLSPARQRDKRPALPGQGRRPAPQDLRRDRPAELGNELRPDLPDRPQGPRRHAPADPASVYQPGGAQAEAQAGETVHLRPRHGRPRQAGWSRPLPRPARPPRGPGPSPSTEIVGWVGRSEPHQKVEDSNSN